MGNASIRIQHADAIPAWLPAGAQHYLAHTEIGMPIRELARQAGLHASTVMRQIRRYETRRDDPLIDAALRQISNSIDKSTVSQRITEPKERPDMTPETVQTPACEDPPPGAASFEQEALRVLNRLVETGAVLAVASDMEKAIIVREGPEGVTTKTGVVDRAIAEMIALRDWIDTDKPGRISKYRITPKGRDALAELAALETGEKCARGDADFADQHRIWGEKLIHEEGVHGPRRMRYNVAESPLASLARRKDKDGKPFLSDTLVSVGERLREDFELAQMGPRVGQNWDRFLTGPTSGGFAGDSRIGTGPEAARARVTAALSALGPGLADVALRCCCYLEGVAKAETHLGWSARSGKIVLRIALIQLQRHYADTAGPESSLIG